MKFILAGAVGLVFWVGVSLLSGAREPWDAAQFWSVIYPAALVLAAVSGAMFQRASVSAGAIVMAAQLPVVMASSGASPLLAAGVVYVVILSIPAMALSWLAGWVWRRRRNA